MIVKKEVNKRILELDAEEAAALDWMDENQPGKFDKFISEYLKTRIINAKVAEDGDILNNMTIEEKNNIRTRIRDKKNAS